MDILGKLTFTNETINSTMQYSSFNNSSVVSLFHNINHNLVVAKGDSATLDHYVMKADRHCLSDIHPSPSTLPSCYQINQL